MRKRRLLLVFIILLLAVGLLLPEHYVIPVQGGNKADWNHQTFWYEPWGKSGVHKGIDIFAKKNTPTLAATSGIVIYQGEMGIGGNVVIVLGAKWKIHYYAHLESINVSLGEFVSQLETIGTVGDTGNAQGKAPHLHYSIVTLLPYLWRWDGETQGWKKIFILNPSEALLALD